MVGMAQQVTADHDVPPVRKRPGQCPACGSSRISDTPPPTQTVRLGRCRTCDLRWSLDPPDARELEVLYRSGFYEPAPPRGAPLAPLLHRVNNSFRLREIAGLTPGRLLDVGCGKGRFLAAARGIGWNVQGLEYAAASAEAARANFGVDVIVGDFLDVPLDNTYDALTMWHVLEHLSDPRGALARAAEAIRPGGRLVVSVPNIDSLQARLGGDAWFHLDYPRHLYHFTPRALSALVEAAGFRVQRITYLYPEMEVIGLIQTALNRVGIERDLLYRFAKRDPTARFGPGVIASVGLALAVAPAAAAWAALAPALRTGVSMQLVAERP
jgi:SAM-dependent methyltransferase